MTKDASPARMVRSNTNRGHARSMIACTKGSFVAPSSALKAGGRTDSAMEPPLPSFGVPRFTRNQIAEDVAVRHLEEGEMTGEHLRNVLWKVSFRNNSAPRNIAGILGLNLRQE